MENRIKTNPFFSVSNYKEKLSGHKKDALYNLAFSADSNIDILNIPNSTVSSTPDIGTLPNPGNTQGIDFDKTISPKHSSTRTYKSATGQEYINIKKLIVSISQKHGVNPRIMCALIEQESLFDPNQVTKFKGGAAYGLCQIATTSDFSKGFTPQQLFVPSINITQGVLQLKNLLTTFNNDYYTALVAYNAGVGRVKRRGVEWTAKLVNGNNPENTAGNYARKIISRANDYSIIY